MTATSVAGQISWLPLTAKQVTLTVGGNDLGFVAKVTSCFSSATTCGLSAYDLAALAALTTQLSKDIAAIHAEAPAATIYVTGYPLLFQALQTPTDLGSCVVGDITLFGGTPSPLPISERQADALDADAVALNSAIDSAIAGPVHRYTKFVDVTGAFDGHGLCGTDSYINAVHMTVNGLNTLAGPLHPNVAGQHAYAAAIRADGFKG